MLSRSILARGNSNKRLQPPHVVTLRLRRVRLWMVMRIVASLQGISLHRLRSCCKRLGFFGNRGIALRDSARIHDDGVVLGTLGSAWSGHAVATPGVFWGWPVGHVTRLLSLDGPAVPALPLVSAGGDGFRHGSGMLMVNELRCYSRWLLWLRENAGLAGTLTRTLPVTFNRCVCCRNIESGDPLVESRIGAAVRAGWTDINHHRAGLLSCGGQWRVVKTFDPREPGYLARSELIGRCGSLVVWGLMVQESARGRSL